MSSQREREMTLSDGRLVDVHYTVESYGYPSNGWDDPGERAELGIDKVLLSLPRPTDPAQEALWLKGHPPFDDAALLITIDQAETDRLEGIIHENPDWWMPYDDPDDYRDVD